VGRREYGVKRKDDDDDNDDDDDDDNDNNNNNILKLAEGSINRPRVIVTQRDKSDELFR
jgi:hypothetical protein